MIIPENLNKNLEQKSYTECVTHEINTLPSLLTPLLYTLALKTPPPPPKKIRFGFFVKIHLLENPK